MHSCQMRVETLSAVIWHVVLLGFSSSVKGVRTVSYTHLDVYKRQIRERLRESAVWNREALRRTDGSRESVG